jgi:hypothetical protein
MIADLVIADFRLRLPIWHLTLNPQSAITIAIRQSENPQPPFDNPQ